MKLYSYAKKLLLITLCLSHQIAFSGYYHVSPQQKEDIGNDFNESILSSRVMGYKSSSNIYRDYYKSNPSHWNGDEAALDSIKNMIGDLYYNGAFSLEDFERYTISNSETQESLNTLIEKRADCEWCKENRSYYRSGNYSQTRQYRERCGDEDYSDRICKLDLAQIPVGLLSDMVTSEVYEHNRTAYLQFIKNKILSDLKVSPLAKEEENCSYRSCQEGLVCTAPQQLVDLTSCSAHSDCPSQVCRPAQNPAERYCLPVSRCYLPQEKGESCDDNPVCAEGLSCRKGVNDENAKCLSCADFGEKASAGKPCCPGMVKDPSQDSDMCIQAIPEDLGVAELFGEDSDKIVLPRQKRPLDIKKCEFDWHQMFMHRLEVQRGNLEREMGLLGFEFVASGENYLDDFWDVNKTLFEVSTAKRDMRRWLFTILKAPVEQEQAEKVLEELNQQVTAHPYIDTSTKSSLNAQFADIAYLKSEYDSVCKVIAEQETQEKEEGKGVQSDGVRATRLAIIITEMEKKLTQVDYNINITPSFQEINEVRQVMTSKNWKYAEEKYFSRKWTQRKSWFKVLADMAISPIKSLVTMDLDPLKDSVDEIKGVVTGDFGGENYQIGSQLSQGIYATMWGETPPRVNKKTEKCWATLSGIKCRYRLDIYWPHSKCDESGTTVLGTSGSCLRRFSYIDYQGKPDVVIDPFIPVGMDQNYFFYKAGSGQQPEFTKLVNDAAMKSINYLKGRKKPGMNSTAIRKAFPEIGKGRFTITEDMKKTIKENAVEYLDQEYEGLSVSDSFKQKWANYVIEMHFSYPKLSKSPTDIGYPQRGLIAYLTALNTMLNGSGQYNEKITENYDNMLTNYNLHLDSLKQRYGLGVTQQTDLEQLEQPENPEFETSDFEQDILVEVGDAQFSVGQDLRKDRGDGASANGQSTEGGDVRTSGNRTSAIAEAYEKNKQKNAERRKEMSQRSENMREQLEKQGQDVLANEQSFGRLFASYGAPSTGGASGGAGAIALQRGGVPESPNANNDQEETQKEDDQLRTAQDSSRFNAQNNEASAYQFGSATNSNQRSGRQKSANSSASIDQNSAENKKIQSAVESMNKSRESYDTDEADSLFEKVTKAYIRNYSRLLNKKTSTLE